MASDGGPSSDRLLLSTRLALLFGFGSLLVAMGVVGLDALRVVQQIRRRELQIRTHFLFKDHLLDEIQSQVYLSGMHIRDYLLDPAPDDVSMHRNNLQRVRKSIESSVESYRSTLASGEIEQYTDLKNELSKYWDNIEPILSWAPEERRRRGYVFLRDEIYPQRTTLLQIGRRIGNANEQELNTGTDRVIGSLLTFQRRLAVTVVATLILGLVMAAFTTRKILRLGASAHARYEQVTEAQLQLKELSARLVQMQETERRALSRELHDEVGQSLSAILFELRNLAAGLSANSKEQSHSHIEEIEALVENTVRVVRNMALLLRPSMLDDLGLIPALRWQAREISKRTGLDVSLATDLVSDDLPDEYKTCLYRVVQEALHNCCDHSQATTVRITVRQARQELSLSIQDDGKGFEVSETKGLGLLGIEERVARLGGRCEVKSNPGSGTILAIALPLSDTLHLAAI